MSQSDSMDEPFTYGVDMGAPNGDQTALSINVGDTLYSYVGAEAEAILRYATAQRIAEVDSIPRISDGIDAYVNERLAILSRIRRGTEGDET